MDCLICGRKDREKPSVFRGEKWCSDLCRKRFFGEIPLRPKDLVTLDSSLGESVVEIGQHAYLRHGADGEVEAEWILGDGRPISHYHVRSGIRYPTTNRTATGDDVEWWSCVECGAQATGWRIGSEGDE